MQAHVNRGFFSEAANKASPQAIPVLMGEFTVIEKKDDAAFTIESPSIQSCVALVLENKEGVAVAHFDTPYGAQELIEEMIEKLKKMGTSKIEATMLGGDFFLLNNAAPLVQNIGESLEKCKILSTSASLMNAIKPALTKHKLSARHEKYSIKGLTLLIPLIYLGLRASERIGPESYFLTAIMMLLLVAAHSTLDDRQSKNYDLNLKLKGKNPAQLTVIENNKNNSLRIFRLLDNKSHRIKRIRERMALNPKATDQQTISRLGYAEAEPTSPTFRK